MPLEQAIYGFRCTDCNETSRERVPTDKSMRRGCSFCNETFPLCAVSSS